MQRSTLQVKGIYKTYSNRKVVNNVSFEIKNGEVVGLLGSNGAGKTTCFYIVCGLIRADQGEVLINNYKINHLPMHKRANLGLGYLPQEPSIFRNLSVAQNIMAVLEINNNTNKMQKKQLLEELLIKFNIGYIRNIKGFSLSGGERRRTEIARAMATNPKFILLDEPFAGIDPIAINDIQQTIHQLKNNNIGILITDHSYREMLNTCDRSYVLHNGGIIAEGNKEEILAHENVKKVYFGETKSAI